MKKSLTLNLTPIAAAVGLMVLSVSMAAQAQQVDTKKIAKEDTQEVIVTGVRAAMEKSLSQKRNAESHMEVITAEDIGKMPDKNVADTLARVPGVTTSSASGNEGGENVIWRCVAALDRHLNGR